MALCGSEASEYGTVKHIPEEVLRLPFPFTDGGASPFYPGLGFRERVCLQRSN
jgi:hypothetical protein